VRFIKLAGKKMCNECFESQHFSSAGDEHVRTQMGVFVSVVILVFQKFIS